MVENNSWSPVLFGQDRLLADQILEKIGEQLSTSIKSCTNNSLVVGKAGQLLFLNEYYGDCDLVRNQIESLITNLANDENLDGSIMTGLAGIGFVLKHINEGKKLIDKSIINELFKYTRSFIVRDARLNNYDLLHGYVGECLFLLQSRASNLNFNTLKTATDNLISIAIQQSRGIGWSSKLELDIQFRRLQKENKSFLFSNSVNLGLSHGLPGILLALQKMQNRYPALELGDTIERALECLESEESESFFNKTGYYYSVYGGTLGSTYGGQLSWCYSDLGVGLMYLNLWQITGTELFYKKGKKLANGCADKLFEITPSMCSGLCHGAAGVAHIFHRIYEMTKDEKFKAASSYWYRILFENYLVDLPSSGEINFMKKNKNTGVLEISIDNGFLEGLSGVGLSIASGISSFYPSWSKILLI